LDEPGTDLAEFAARRRGLFYPKADLPAGQLALAAEEAAGAADYLPYLCGRHLGTSPEAVCLLGDQGTFHRIYRAAMPGGRDVIVRFNVLAEPAHDHGMSLDRWAARTQRAAGLPACEVLVVDLTRRFCPWDYQLLEPAPGVSLRQFDDDEAGLRPHLVRLGAFLAALHQIATNGHGLLVPDETGESVRGSCRSWGDYLGNHLARHLGVCRDIGAVTAEEVRDIERAFAVRTPAVSRPVLLHGDPGNHNVFVSADAVTAMIDWEDALSGDAAHEVAFWATFHPERRHPAFFEGYFDGCQPGDDFLERFWLYFLRVSLAKTVVRHNLGLKDRPGRPPASLRIQRGLRGLYAPRRAA
jgi:aminoglycoside phosphotransferase (APT) family kinase protein